MTNQPTPNERLNKLSVSIEAARERLRLQHVLYAEHGPTLEELAARHKELDRMLADEVDSEERHGHHVSQLEQAFRAWVNHLNFDL
ncbi:hypothetical protein [Henriciella mobilis]|uniref:hypothetical protein n=1 Tax=Henriciella mobilis TaxID=2305467 RepID=UPI0011C49981|nr:hypothetical protein [Henriciella mobilis]